MSDRRGDDLPIKFGPVSNGEFYPVPHTPLVAETIRRTNRLADANARRLGISCRRFLKGASGAAATLLVLGACSKERNAAESASATRSESASSCCRSDPDSNSRPSGFASCGSISTRPGIACT